MTFHEVVEFLGLVLEKQGVEVGVAGDLCQGLVEGVAKVTEFVTGACRVGDVQLTFADLVFQLISQRQNLSIGASIT